MKRLLSYLAALALFAGANINFATFAAEGEEEIVQIQLGEAPELEKALKELEQLPSKSVRQALTEKIETLKDSKELEDQSLSSLANKFAAEFKKSEAQYKTTGKASNELINAAAFFIAKLGDILMSQLDNDITLTKRKADNKEIQNALTQLENALAPFAYAKLSEFMTIAFPVEVVKPANLLVASILATNDWLVRHLQSHYVTGKTMGAIRARAESERLWPVRGEFNPKVIIEIKDDKDAYNKISLLDLAELHKINLTAEQYAADVKKDMESSLNNIIAFLKRLGVTNTKDGLKLMKERAENIKSKAAEKEKAPIRMEEEEAEEEALD